MKGSSLRAIALLLGSVAACRPAGGSFTPAELVDDAGTSVRLGSPPRRIVSLNPTTTELLFALGAAPRLTGRSEVAAARPDSRLETELRAEGAAAGGARVPVLLLAWALPVIALGAGTFVSELVELAGGRNIFADITAPSAAVSHSRRSPPASLPSPAARCPDSSDVPRGACFAPCGRAG